MIIQLLWFGDVHVWLNQYVGNEQLFLDFKMCLMDNFIQVRDDFFQ